MRNILFHNLIIKNLFKLLHKFQKPQKKKVIKYTTIFKL